MPPYATMWGRVVMHIPVYIQISCFFGIFLPLQVSKEKNRFEKLMEYFTNDDSNIDFMVGP